MKEVKPSKKPLLFYYSIVLLCVVLFNAFIAPMQLLPLCDKRKY